MSAPSMLKGCFSGVSGMLQRCFRHVSEMFQKRFGDDSGMLEGCFDNVFGVKFECFKYVSRIFQPCFQGSFRNVCETANKMTMKIRKFVWDRFNILCFHGRRFRDHFQTEILRTTVRYTLSALGLVLGTISH